MSFDLCLWGKCNNRCRMCTNPPAPWPAWDGSFEYDYDSIIARLENKKEEIKKSDSIYITGGEPTIHPRFKDILKYLNTNFPKQTKRLLSNGRSFSYEKYAQEILALEPDLEIDMSLYGPNALIHDAVTQAPGSFAQSCQGLKNLLINRSENQVVGLRFVLTRESYKSISEFLELVTKEFRQIDRLIIIFPEYEAKAIDNKSDIMIKYFELKPIVDNLFENILELSKLTEVRLYHFPLCAVDRKFWPLVWKTWPEHEVEFIEACQRCQMRKYCVGPHKGYLQNVGTDEFVPFSEHIEVEESGNVYRPVA
ncbi:MAG: radical SAM protein [Candidatus Magasanikbacteria bacterium]|nr:radical SAM protein [Candidatus Magasanikbacteria bacterium]